MRPVLKHRRSTTSERKNANRPVIDPYLMEIDSMNTTVKKGSPHIKTIDSSKSKQFFKMNKNRNCDRLDFDKCVDQDIQLVGIPVVIGNGTFGILLRIHSNSREGDVAIKFIFNIDAGSSSTRFIDMEKELSYSYYMGSIGIGPKVLDSFHYSFDLNELNGYPVLKKITDLISDHFKNKGIEYPQFYPVKNAILRREDPGKLPIEIQCIVMKAYDKDCENALLDPNLNTDIKVEIIRQMVHLIEKQIMEGMYCYDIKPGNFVVNIRNNIDVKMIDFGADFCTEKKIYIGFDNNQIEPFLGINYIQLLYISDVLQLFAIFTKTGYLNTISQYDQKKILMAFFYNNLFKIFFSRDWRSFINWYIDYANHLHKIGKNDPATNLVWYSNTKLSNSRQIEKIYSADNIRKIKHFLINNLDLMLATVNKP
jgi:hypothetical protein